MAETSRQGTGRLGMIGTSEYLVVRVHSILSVHFGNGCVFPGVSWKAAPCFFPEPLKTAPWLPCEPLILSEIK